MQGNINEVRLKTALITGVTGQDGSYLAESLIKKGYKVWGIVRRSSSFNTGRINQIIESLSPDPFDWRRADLTDESSLTKVLMEVEPDEIYNLGAQSHVKVSFEVPVYSFDVDALGTLRLLEAVKSSSLNCRIYQAGSSEMFGSAPPPQNEESPFKPRSAYAIAKTAAHHACVTYRDAYGMWISNGILFNHESPRRGETFVTRKISRAVARIFYGVQSQVLLGNLDSKRDWGYAPEYVEIMWAMLQQRKPDDYVIATGEAHSVQEFVEEAFAKIGVILKWSGNGIGRKALVESFEDGRGPRMKIKKNDVVLSVSPDYLRPNEVDFLQGDSARARKKLGWNPKVKFKDLVRIMVDADIRNAGLLLDGTRKHNEEWREHLD